VSRERIAILGGGASGTLLAAELLRRAQRPLEIALVEPRSALGRGPAYTTSFAVHVMNVPAARLSARADDPDHFLAWLRRRDPQATGTTFAPRAHYGRYLQEVVTDARVAARRLVELDHVRDEVTDVRPGAGGGFAVALAAAPPLVADRVVLALGNLPPDALRRLAPAGGEPERFVCDPWAPGAFDFPSPEGDVLVLGTGLTAVDVVLGLRHRGHEGRVVAVSRHGFLPRVHAFPAPRPAPVWELAASASLRETVAEVRRQLARTGGDFRLVVDGLRGRTQALWRALAPADRARFLRHLQPFWDVHRHRMAPEVDAGLRAQLATGAVRVLAGRVEALQERCGVVHASIRPRGAHATTEVAVRHVVDCTGPAPLARTSHPLVRRLLASGLVRTDALGLGLDATPDGRLVSLENRSGDRLFALGPLLRGALWETTAMGEIRAQAAGLAERLLGLGRPPSAAARALAEVSGDR
jgi:uncharacterized NAD(P)/FAD-binding protein YdhS